MSQIQATIAANDLSGQEAVATPDPSQSSGKANKKGTTGKAQSEDLAFMQDLREAMLVQKTPGSMLLLYLIGAFVVVAPTWAYFAKVEEITQGEARVIPASREQVIQSLEGGILETMNVREGDIVERGQVLLEIDPTRAGASYREGLSKVVGLKAAVARLRAEAYQQPLVFPPDVQKMPSIVKDEPRLSTRGARRSTKACKRLTAACNWPKRKSDSPNPFRLAVSCRRWKSCA